MAGVLSDKKIGERDRSASVFRASEAVIPGGVNSPVRSFYHLNMAPLIVASGSGDTIVDVDSNSYIDYCCSWGALILGHCQPDVVRDVKAQVDRGSSFGIATECEQQLAQLVTQLVPSVQKIRFVSSGTEATMSAIRLARGFTGRDLLVKFNGNYHGHSDSLLVKAGSGATDLSGESFSAGVPKGVIEQTVSLPYNDVEGVRAFLLANKSRIAAVILEPIAGNMGLVPASQAFIDMLGQTTKAIAALLIFDEVITGFRAHLKGAQNLYGATPDLTCFGKVIGGGYPLAAFGGRAEIMDHLAPLGPVYQAGTLSGNPVAVTAGLATLKQLQVPYFYENLEAKTRRLTAPIAAFITKHRLPACITQAGSLFTLFFGPRQVASQNDLQDLDCKRFESFFKFLFERGIYAPPSAYEAWFVSAAHTEEHLDYTAQVILEFLTEISEETLCAT